MDKLPDEQAQPSGTQPQPPYPPSLQPKTPIEISDAFKLYEFSAKQVSDSRASFEQYYRTTLGAIFAVVTVGGIVFGFLGWDKYKDIESSVTQRAETHFQKVDQDMQSMLRQRIDDEFKTEKIQELIRTEAKAQTKEGLKNEISSLRQDVDSTRASVAAVLRRQVGPFAWSMSLIGPDFDASPGTRAGNYLASFIPNEDITVMRIVAPFGGRGYVDTEDPCSHPPSFYLSVGEDRGASNAKYAISMLGAGAALITR